MIRQAALYFPTPDDARAALLEVAGRPVAFRALMAVVRAGIPRVGVPTQLRGTDVERAIASSPSARAAAVWLGDGALDDAPTLLVPATALVPPAALARLGVRGSGVLAESRELAAPVVVVDAPRARALRARLAAGAPLAEPLREAAPLQDEALQGGAGCVRVTDRAGAARAERRLYATLGSPIDTRFDRLVHRRLSRPASRLAVACGIAPNTITILSLGAGLLAGWCLWRGTPDSAVAGLLLYFLAVVLDHSDGEVARLTLRESVLGEWLDMAVDTVVLGSIVLAMGVTAARVAGGGGTTVGWVAAAGVVASAALAKVAPAVDPSGGEATDRVGWLLAGLGTRDGYYAMLGAYVGLLLVRPAALPLLMVVVAAGAHAYWLGRAAHAIARARAS